MAGTVKAFNLSIDYVLYDLSYVNLTLYGAALPSYKTSKNKTDRGHDVIDAGDPRNKNKVRAFLDAID